MTEFRVAWLAFWQTVADCWHIDRAVREMDRATRFLVRNIKHRRTE